MTGTGKCPAKENMEQLPMSRAMRESKALCKVLGPGWKPDPFRWLNGWVPRARCGAHVSLYPYPIDRTRRYFAQFDAVSLLAERGATPRSTAKKLLARLKLVSETMASHVKEMKKRA